MGDITVQIRTSSGAKRTTLSASAPLSQLKSVIQDLVSIPAPQQILRIGYPPIPIPPNSDSKSLQSLSIHNGETIIVELNKDVTVVAEIQQAGRGAGLRTGDEGEEKKAGEMQMIRRIIASDGSCLFNAVGYALEGHRRNAASELRDVIIGYIRSDPETYTSAHLGKAPEEYCQWIRQPSSWGGAIEISILSKFYKVQIVCVSIQTVSLDVFGEEEGFLNRIYVLYDNIHYDALARNTDPTAPESSDVTIFPVNDQSALSGVLALAQSLNQLQQYTDLTGCALVCGICRKGFKGEREAIKHCNETGHMNFQEVTK